MHNIFKRILIILFLSSCSINGNLKGLLSNYKKTKKEEPQLIVKLGQADSLIHLSYVKQVVLINGKQLKQALAQYEDAVVYFWQPNCHSKYCYALNLAQKYCEDRKIEFFVVAQYFDARKMTKNYELKRPIFGIDINYYHTNFTTKYVSRFSSDLTGSEDFSGNFAQFKAGNFRRFVTEIDSL